MHRIFHIKAYEKEHGPHFNEEHARKAVMKMENEDGTRGPLVLVIRCLLKKYQMATDTLYTTIRITESSKQ